MVPEVYKCSTESVKNVRECTCTVLKTKTKAASCSSEVQGGRNPSNQKTVTI